MPYLAMTATEFRGCQKFPEKIAWMACHFSPYGTGLTNLPTSLPPGSVLILNDRTPIAGHDPQRIFEQLETAAKALKCQAVLLDFQRPDCHETAETAKKLLSLPCPVVVSEGYAGGLDCPVFLPPVPLNRTVKEYISPWQGREIWLDAALDDLQITVTEKGSTFSSLLTNAFPACPHQDEALFCHYAVAVSHDKAVFTLHRTKEDLHDLLSAAKAHGITNSVGLYQELGG